MESKEKELNRLSKKHYGILFDSLIWSEQERVKSVYHLRMWKRMEERCCNGCKHIESCVE